LEKLEDEGLIVSKKVKESLPYNFYRLSYATELVKDFNQLERLTRTSSRGLLELVNNFNQLIIAKYGNLDTTKPRETLNEAPTSKGNELVNEVNTQDTFLDTRETTTTNSSSFDAPLEEKPLSDTMLDIRNLQSLLHIKYAKQIGGDPSDGHCRVAVDQFEFHRLQEAIERMPVALRPEITKSNIVNTVIKYVENPNWGRVIERDPQSGLAGAKRDEAQRELQRLEGEFAFALADDSDAWLPKKLTYLRQQFPKINHIRKLLGLDLMPESVLEEENG